MNKKMPLIGITPGCDYEKNVAFVKNGYCDGVNKAGGLAMIIPLSMDKDLLDVVFETCDGFVISGGPDIDAKYYGENNLMFNGEISPHRDVLEIYLIKKAIEYNKPVFGICRGIQVMNVAMGGTLYQDIHSQIKDSELIKHSQNAPKWYPTHDVLINRGSKIWESFKKDLISVNSFHHQAIKDIAPGFVVTSRSPDGIAESIEYDGHIFAVGVQWHPELMWQQDNTFLKLFEDFVNCCKIIK